MVSQQSQSLVTVTGESQLIYATSMPQNIEEQIIVPSAVDQVTSPLAMLPATFLYSKPPDESLLKHAMEMILKKWTAFSGRLRWSSNGNLEVLCNNSGASFSTATSPMTIKELMPSSSPSNKDNTSSSSSSSSYIFTPTDMVPFYPYNAPKLALDLVQKDLPLMYAQLTHLADGGACLVLFVPHLLADLKSIRTLMETWAFEYNRLVQYAKAGKLQSWLSSCSSTGSTGIDTGTGTGLLSTPDSPSSVLDKSTDFNNTTTNSCSLLPPLYGRQALDRYLPIQGPPHGFTPNNAEERTMWTIPKWMFQFYYHVKWRGGGVRAVGYYVSGERLKELKNQAMSDIKERAAVAAEGEEKGGSGSTINKEKGGSGSTINGPPPFPPSSFSSSWVSTNDALVARIWQAMYTALPEKQQSPLSLAIELRQRLNPPLPDDTMGNVLLSVPITAPPSSTTTTTISSFSADLSLGELALSVRQAIQSIDQEAVINEFAWVEDKFGKGTKLPCVVPACKDPLLASGGMLVSNWDWSYDKLAFGEGNVPVWHQTMISTAPNVAFVVNGVDGGAYVFMSLNSKLADRVEAEVKSL